MVDCQLRPNAITDGAVLAAMGAVPREMFVPKAQRMVAYIDEDTDLGDGRYLIEPLVLARLLQMAEIGPGDAGLVVGCGTGYAAAVMARLLSSIVAVEASPERVEASGALLSDLGCDNVAVVEGDIRSGYSDQAPYNVILFSGAVAEIPDGIAEQLDEGGRLVCVVDADCQGLGQAVLITRHEGIFSEQVVHHASTPILPGFAREEGFVF